ncbi:MAG: c-type cytochrome [Pirellulales bacterium]|nr:c-type cytochrome [Pirellulales bacterium]
MRKFRFIASVSVVLGVFCAIFGGATLFAQKPATEQLATLRPAPGQEVQLFAAEPLIINPSCLDVDSRGRVWAAEIQWYRSGLKDPPSDKIKVLEDTDGDGQADKATIFAEGLTGTMSLCVAGDKVYSIVKGDLLMWTDKDGDLRADGPPQILVRGFSNQNHDHVGHSLYFGPDHKWYMAHGDTGFNATGSDGSQIQYKWGAMIRGEGDGSQLEMVAVNFRNPYEICVSSFGEMYCSDNDNDGNESVRICWILEGGDYGWFGGPPFGKQELDQRVPPGTPYREHWHFRGYQLGYVPGTLVTGFGSPCGMCYYEGEAFGPKFKNAPLHCDPGPRVVRLYRHEPAGYGPRATSEVFLTNQGDDYFRPDDICAAPDGSLYISDWYDGGVGGHAYNNPTQGRIFRLVPTGKKLTSAVPPGPYTTTEQALAALASPNLDTQFQAREKILAEGKNALPLLVALFNDTQQDPNLRARVLWLLDRISGAGREAVIAQLNATDEQFRALAVKILARHGQQHADLWTKFATDEKAPASIRREALLGIGRMLRGKDSEAAAGKYGPMLAGLIAQADSDDRYYLETLIAACGNQRVAVAELLSQQPQLSAKGLDILGVLHPERAGELFASRIANGKISAAELRQLLLSSAAAKDAALGQRMVGLLQKSETSAEVKAAIWAALAANINSGWSKFGESRELQQQAIAALRSTGLEQAAALELIKKANWRDAAGEVLALIGSPDASNAVKSAALAILVDLRPDNLVATLRAAREKAPAELRLPILRALIQLQDSASIRDALTAKSGTDAERGEMLKLAFASPGSALALLKLVEEKSLAAELRDQVIGMAAQHPDSNVRLLFERYLPADQRSQKLGDAIKAEDILKLAGNARRGQGIFMESNAAQCKNCHMVAGQGSTIGPDLSMIGKKYERAALLETILQPSKAISHEYVPYLLETTQGQTYLGFLVEGADSQVTLKDVQGNQIRIPKNEVETLAKQEISLMPELVLKDISAQDAADLLAYLQTLTKGTTVAGSFRILGPLPKRDVGIDTSHALEKTAADPDPRAKFAGGPNGGEVGWEVVTSDGELGFVGIDTVKYSQKHGGPPAKNTHYALVYAESLTDQNVELLVSSDDHCKVWVNGEEIHKFVGSRALAPEQDTVPVKLRRGRNVILLKVVNEDGPGGFALAVKSTEPVSWKTE